MTLKPRFSLFFLLLLALTAYAQMQERIAIIQTLDTRDSVSIPDLAYLTDRLRETAVKILPKDRYGVMTTESIVAFLGSMENTVKVCKAASCLAELGRKVSADYVTQGLIGRFGNDLTIKVELYNVKTGNLMDSFTGYSKDIYGLLALIDEKAPDLFKNMAADASSVKKTVPPPTATAPSPTPVTPPEPEYVEPEEPEVPIEMNQEEYTRQLEIRSRMYDRNRKKFAPVWAMLNLFYGAGSYVQGNIWVGVIISVLEIGGLAADIESKLGATLFGSGFAIGLIAPFVHQYTYNKSLLNIDNDISLSIDPLIIPKDGTPSVGLAFNLRY